MTWSYAMEYRFLLRLSLVHVSIVIIVLTWFLHLHDPLYWGSLKCLSALMLWCCHHWYHSFIFIISIFYHTGLIMTLTTFMEMDPTFSFGHLSPTSFIMIMKCWDGQELKLWKAVDHIYGVLLYYAFCITCKCKVSSCLQRWIMLLYCV